MIGRLLWREKPDGTRALAYPVYLAGALAAWGVIYLLHERLMPPGGAVLTHARRRGADVSAITGAASMASPIVAQPAPEALAARSYRMRPEGQAKPAKRRHAAAAPEPAAEEIDAIDESLRAPVAADPTAAGLAALLPALPPQVEGEGSGRAPRAMLLGYRDPGADENGTAERSGPAVAAPVLARGALIPVYLLTSVDTSSPAAVLQFAAAEDVVSHGLRRLGFGTRFLGRLSGHAWRDRVTLVVDTVLYPDGRHEPISATAVEADARGAEIRPGVAATFIPPPAWVQTAPYLSEFVTGFLGLLQSRAQQGIALRVGGVSLASTVPEDAKGPAYEAAGQAAGDFTRARLGEWEERYAAYDYVPAGTVCWLQLDADFAGIYARAP